LDSVVKKGGKERRNMLDNLLKFVYFDIGFRLRGLLWNFFLASNGGHLGKNPKLYEGIRIVMQTPGSIRIGDRVTILRSVTINTLMNGKISIGNGVHIGEGSMITSEKEIVVNDKVIIGPHNIIVDVDHSFSKKAVPIINQGFVSKKIWIGEDVWISSHCLILKGVTIGRGAVIGAGSVVTKDVPEYTVVAGNPARFIKNR
jgi:acetyltransferase-like isoleucine patch superfamily enzyme